MKTGRLPAPSLTRESRFRLRRVIHIELDRMGRHPEPRELVVLQRDVGLEEVLREYAAARQERMIVFQALESLLERCTNVRHFLRLFRRQVVEVLVDRISRMNL